MTEGGVRLARRQGTAAPRARRATTKRSVKRGVDMAVAKAVTRTSSKMAAYGTRMPANTASHGMGRPVNRKKAVRTCSVWG